jgi:hypothetical protein
VLPRPVLEVANPGLSIGAPEEIRTPDPQIRRLLLHLPRPGRAIEKIIYRWLTSQQAGAGVLLEDFRVADVAAERLD